MMQEEDEFDLSLGSSDMMAEVEVSPPIGPKSSDPCTTALVAPSNSTVEENLTSKDIEIVEKEQANQSLDGEDCQDGDEGQVIDKANIEGSVLSTGGTADDEKKESDKIQDKKDIDYAAKLFGDSKDDDAFGIVKENVVKQSDLASKLFDTSADTTREYIGEMTINESFEIIGNINKSLDSQGVDDTQRNEPDNSVKKISDGANVSQSSIESSFETLSMKHDNPSPYHAFKAPYSHKNQVTTSSTTAPDAVDNYFQSNSDINTHSSVHNEQNMGGFSNPMPGIPAYSTAATQISHGSVHSNTQTIAVSEAQHQLQSNTGQQLPGQQQVNNYQGMEASSYQAAHGSSNAMHQGAQVNHDQVHTYQGSPNQGQAFGVQNQLGYSNHGQSNVSPLLNVADYSQQGGKVKPNAVTPPYTMTTALTTAPGVHASPISSVLPGYDTSQPGQHQMPNPLQQTPSPTSSGLFVPDLYGSLAPSSGKFDIFVPAAPSASQMEQQQATMNYNASPASGNMYPQQMSKPPGAFVPEMSPAIHQVPLSMHHRQGDVDYSKQDPGLIDWVKQNMGQDWSEGAKKFGQQIIEKTKSATETVLTTLDPGMEEYLNPVMNLAIASLDNKIITGIRRGFRGIFGHTAARGHVAQLQSVANLPIGFEAGVKATKEQLDVICNVNFQFSGECVFISSSPFLTELQQGRWSCMLCVGLRDLRRQIELYCFSQPVSVPLECVLAAYNRTNPDDIQQKLGYSVTIDEAVRLYKPYPVDQDWCFTLTGMTLESILASASHGLAADYRREIEKPTTNASESIAIIQ
eukprot:gene9621-10604_t